MEYTIAGGVVIEVDSESLLLCESYRWYMNPVKEGLAYARAGVGGKAMYLHRLIAGADPGEMVDHINGNTLDNRRINLRICTLAQNNANVGKKRGCTSSQYCGVSPCGKKWLARIREGAKNHYLGMYERETDAAEAFNRAAIRLRGEFARLNVVPKGKRKSEVREVDLS